MAGKAQNFTQRQHMLRPGYEIFRYCDSELGEVSLHHHDFYEIYLFLNGSVEYSIESRIYRLLPGDILLIGPMELHQPASRRTTAPMSGWCSGWTSGIWNSSAPPDELDALL
ncbi:MAG: AraC family ligand binding domain-containing protein [Ruthenibacterium lactatiformans]